MTSRLPFGLDIPVLYVNPSVNADTRLAREVSLAGGLGILAADRRLESLRHIGDPDFPHGLRLPLGKLAELSPIGAEMEGTLRGRPIGPDSTARDMFSSSSSGGTGILPVIHASPELAHTDNLRLLLIPLEDADTLADFPEGGLTHLSVPVMAEVGNASQAQSAERAGVAALTARGHEGPGWVSQTSGLVLLQEILRVTELPVFLQGGIGLRTAAGAVAAGAAGVILDVHLLFAAESALPGPLKAFLESLGLPATLTLEHGLPMPLRVYSRVGTKSVRDLRKQAESLTEDRFPAYQDQVNHALIAPLDAPDTGDALLPLSEDIGTAKRLGNEYGNAAAIVRAFAEKISHMAELWPLADSSALCAQHRTRVPIVQGPMAHVSDNPNFLAAIADNGALPFLAMGNMPAPIAKEGLKLARGKTHGCFGVGLIGLDINKRWYEPHLELMKENPPPFAILAAGSVELAKRIEAQGTRCYLHCPAPGVVTEALKAGLRTFVFEGCESGGHIGNLGSLDLWSANLDALDDACRNRIPLEEVSVLFAGGIGSGRAAAFVAGMVNDLAAKGLQVGLQMGTAYLTTDEAVSTCAITPTYQSITIRQNSTVVIGKTVGIKARAAGSSMAATLIEREHERLRAAVPLQERKHLYEIDNLGSLRLASKGCAIDPDTATWDCPVFCDLPPEEQIERGLYLMGQVVTLLDRPRTIAELHDEILVEGRRVFLESLDRMRKWEEMTGAMPVPPKEFTENRAESVPARDTADGSLPMWGTPSGLPASTPQMELPEEPIAVVGIGLRFPGSDSPERFWQQILERRSGICEVPPERWENPDYYYDPDPKVPDKTYSRIGGFVTDFSFDPLKFRIPPSVAEKMDRTQQLAVTCVAEALADAGLSKDDLKGKRVGTFLGNSMGGGTTDLYATRLGVPRTVACLEAGFKELGLDNGTCDAILKDFRTRFLEGLPAITEDSLPGELPNVISGRVANVFNLVGPNFTVDAACASSMAAMMNAVSELRRGSIDFAFTGGVDTAMHPSSFVKFCKVGALSPDGSRPFDEGANGFVMGEGCGIVLLKRLSDAVRDRDRIYGTIVAIGSSSDGKGKGITAPNSAGQERALHAAYDAQGISPSSVGLIEAHGTSTAVGDKTELQVLDAMFRKIGLSKATVGIGSVKSQIGHLKAAAGAAGVIKAVLSLHHRTLPPTMNLTKPNPCIDWESSPLQLLTESRPWDAPVGQPRVAGVSAFGFGGTNFHIVVQEHVPELRVISGKRRAESIAPTRVISDDPAVGDKSVVREYSTAGGPSSSSIPLVGDPSASSIPLAGGVRGGGIPIPDWPALPQMDVSGEAWVIGGSDDSDLARRITAVLDSLSPDVLAGMVGGLREEASLHSLRVGFAARNLEEAKAKLTLVRDALTDPKKKAILPAKGVHLCEKAASRAKTGVAFLFPGQGSQYPYMLRDLAERFPVVAETYVEADEILESLGVPAVSSGTFPSLESIRELGANQADMMKDTQILQPMILAANVAIFRLVSKMGLKPAAVAGHSLGEYAACVAAGVFSFRDALEAVAVRGREMARVSIADPGLMMSIPADARFVEDVLSEVDGYVVAANKNSPKQTVISGETAAVTQAGELFKARGLDGILIPVSAAFHSGVVAPAREPFMKTLRKLTVNPPQIPVLSNVTGDFYPVGPAAPESILDLLGKQFAAPVEWVKSMRRLYKEGIRIFVECGPKRVLTNMVLDTLSKDVLTVPLNHPKKGGIIQLLETLAALTAEGIPLDLSGGDQPTERPRLTVVPQRVEPKPEPHPLESLLDDEIRKTAEQTEFKRYLDTQGNPIRSLIKSGFENYLTNILPLERTAIQVKSEGMDFRPPVVSGLAAGLPSDVRFPFDRESLDDLILGRNFIKKVSDDTCRQIVEKNVERLVKGPSGEAGFEVIENVSGVIKLAGYFSEGKIIDEYALDNRIVRAMDVTTKLAVAAGIEALRDAGIPLVQQTRMTSTGATLPDAWALPEELRAETGVIFASAFPGLASLVDEVTREAASRYGSGAKSRLIEFYSGLIGRITDPDERERITSWFVKEFGGLESSDTQELFTFNRDFLLKVMVMAQGQFAQLIKAQGPNTHVDAACASTTQGMLLARDWIRTGQAKRVIIIAADDVAGRTLLPWIGTGFLAMGAATIEGNVSDAALPFDDRRNGLILGSAAVGIVVENPDSVEERGMEPIASIEAGIAANSAFHGTRLDVDHIASAMDRLISRWEEQSHGSRDRLAEDLFFMSHETYSPKRGGSSAAEINALRKTFGEKARLIPISNTKGFTGHTMGVGVEDVVALRSLQKGMIPPIPNLRNPDPDFADLNLSRGGKCDANYVLRLAAGFGSQIVMALYKVKSRAENRITDIPAHRNWLKKVVGFDDPMLFVENRTLRVAQRKVERVAASESAVVAPQPVAEPVPTAAAGQDVRETILKLLSEKTGYPSDMLDTGLDLEADLGIDTVKQAEFITEVRETFQIPRIDGIKIADFPTIEHIIGFVLEHSGGTQAPAAPVADREDVRGKILAMLSEKTGYPQEMLDTDLDLEADLGIDTVKQAEFITEVRETFSIPRIEGLKIADFPTIEKIIGFVLEHTVQAAQPAPIADEHNVKETILTLLSQKTGYPADMLDVELDLEADLGIDTVKQAEFITEVREAFNIPRIEGLKIADFPTIRHIIGFVVENAGAGVPTQEEPAQPVQEAAANTPEIGLFETRLVALPALGKLPLPEADEVLLIGPGGELATHVEQALRALGYGRVTRMDQPTIGSDLSSKRVGIVNLLPMDNRDTHRTFELYIALAQTFEQGPAFLVTVVSEDGALGFDLPSERGHLAGVIAGATKSVGREFPHTRTRIIDVHPELGSEEIAALIARSLGEAFPLETAAAKDGALRAVRLVPADRTPDENGPASGDVVLVTGGGRGITATCLLEMARQEKLTFFILGRTALSGRAEKLSEFVPQQWEEEKKRIVDRLQRAGTKPTPVLVEKELSGLRSEAEVYRTIRDLKGLGSEVIYRAVDVRDSAAVHNAVGEAGDLLRSVDVVIHAAGIDVSRALRSKSLEQIETVVSVKLDGMRNVLDALESHGLPPRRIVGFGSVSGRFGNLAQVDYSAANDGLAHMLRRAARDLDAKVSIIDWAPWSDVGMAASGSVHQTLEAAGIDFIAPERGARLLLREISRASDAVEVLAAGRLGPFTADAFDDAGSATSAVTGGSSGDDSPLPPSTGGTEKTQVTPLPRTEVETDSGASLSPVHTGASSDLVFAGQRARIEEMVPGEYLRATVYLDPKHPLLDHHRIDRAAVFPGVGGMEVMRAAARTVDQSLVDADFADIRFHSPVKVFKDQPFEAEVQAARIKDAEGAYHCRIVSWMRDKAGRRVGAERLHHECRITRAQRGPSHERVSELWTDSIRVGHREIYEDFFHGPAFYFLDHLRIHADGRGVRFRFMDTELRDRMFTDLVPAVVEAVFQAGAGFGGVARGVMILPTGTGKVELHAADMAPYDGELILVGERSLEGVESRKVLRFDGEIWDREGRVVLSLTGVEMAELQPKPPIIGMVYERMVPVASIMEEMARDRDRFVAEVFHGSELSELEKKAVPKRAAEWVAGRVALKTGVRGLLGALNREAARLNEMCVEPDEMGKPTVKLPGNELWKGAVSLTHSNGMAMAAVSAPGDLAGLGIDVERVEARSDAWAQDYFTPEELELAGRSNNRDRTLTMCWSLKEAALKALGIGLRVDLKEICVESLDPNGSAQLRFRGGAESQLGKTPASGLQAWVEEADGVVIARVIIPK